MSYPHSIPPWVREELDRPAAPGERHRQIVRLAVSLTRAGHSPEHICALLRPQYDPDVPDREIESAVKWAATRCVSRPRGYSSHSVRPRGTASHSPRPERDPEREITLFLSGFSVGEADLFEASPIRLGGNWSEDSLLLISTLFRPGERVNIVTQAAIEGGKARPTGRGRTLTREEWLAEIAEKGTPQGPGGAWLRMNPVSGAGVSDADIIDCRHLLLEADLLSLAIQVSFFARLPLPVVAILTSGGRSVHAWVRLAAPDPLSYQRTASAIFAKLAPYGIDPANKNPSRLSRLPGAVRQVGGAEDRRQRLLYLAPDRKGSLPILP